MASIGKASLPADMQLDEFRLLLDQYPALLQALSDTKGAKPGQKSLQELDDYRYVEAPDRFGGEQHHESMGLDDVKALVEWKLRHGTFRPMLMNLVSSNDAELTTQTIKQAMKVYREAADVPAALGTLTKLKGIGPATASLLLTVHDPHGIIFFSDEAFYWLCNGGKKGPIKYNAKEYESLRANAKELMDRLSIRATDIEKVAYVVMKQGKTVATAAKASSPAEKISSHATSPPPSISAKRRPRSDADVARDQAGVRRSKRVKS